MWKLPHKMGFLPRQDDRVRLYERSYPLLIRFIQITRSRVGRRERQLVGTERIMNQFHVQEGHGILIIHIGRIGRNLPKI